MSAFDVIVRAESLDAFDSAAGGAEEWKDSGYEESGPGRRRRSGMDNKIRQLL